MKASARYLASWATAVVCLLGATSASAQLKILINGTKSDSIQTFSEDALNAYDLQGISVVAKGNTRMAGTSYRMPVTEIYLGSSKYTGIGGAAFKGASSGAALEIVRISDVSGKRIGLTLANFAIDYQRKQVLADITPFGGVTLKAQPLYNFKVIRPIVIGEPNAAGKYIMEEKLGNLRLTPGALAQFTTALELDEISVAVSESIEFGTLAQTIDLTPRAVTPTAPYVPL